MIAGGMLSSYTGIIQPAVTSTGLSQGQHGE